MNFFKFMILLIFLFAFSKCEKEDIDPKPDDDTMYFPDNSRSAWDVVDMARLGWNLQAVPALKDFLVKKNTKSFMILVNGRIVMEEYFDDHTPSSTWQWNSAGKTLVSATTGIAQQERYLDINDKVSMYLGTGWTSEPIEKENLITSRHLLTMTSGLNDEKQFVVKKNLTYLADAGSRWAYSNVFQKLMDVVAASTNRDYESYFNEKLQDKIGMEGFWDEGLIFTIYHSTTRSMARFGLLALNNGKWKGEQIIDESYFNDCVSTSQDINPSYGYLWWLNGEESYMIPGGQTVYDGPLVPNAPSDMYAAMGAAEQRLYVIPGKNMVVVRMGEVSDPENRSIALSGFDQALWEKIK